MRKSLNLRVQDWASDATSLWVKLVFPDYHTPLLVGICYLPPAGSRQLTAISLADRLAALEADLLSACSAGDVILAGDFNARVGALDDSPDADHPLPPRGATDITVTQSGQLLVDICRRSGVALGTGRIPGDEVACPTFRARRHTQATRPDHVVFKSATLSRATSLKVNTTRLDSDHFPMELGLRFPVSLCAPPACHGVDVHHISWSPECRDAFASALRSPAVVDLVNASQAAASGADVGGAVSHLHAAVCAAAAAAGMQARASGRLRPNGTAHRPYFDAQCLASKRAVRACLRRGGSPEEVRVLERQYHGLVRSKQRAFQQQRLHQFLAAQQSDPRRFWKHLRAIHSALPPQLQGVQHWQLYLKQVGSLPLPNACYLPHGAFPQHANQPATVLNAPITLAEVQLGLQRLNNGRSTGRQGLPAELLRYAQHVPTADNPHCPHLLAPVLQTVLNSAFQHGHVPSSVNTALVTPVFKRGDVCDTANYRPIAVTEPIMRLYANILNTRLVEFT